MQAESPALLEWSNITYTVHKRKFNWRSLKSTEKSYTILNDVSGSARGGQLIAVMGPSGAGKTSLLAAISQRLRCPRNGSHGQLSGHSTLQGHVVSRAQMIGRSAFVTQFDIAPDGLTAREHLRFMCELRGVRRAKLEPVLAAVSLQKAGDCRVAVMSGGEKKRLNLAAEILTDPSVIFCDEPTTGLDSYSALSVVHTLRNLTRTEQGQLDASGKRVLVNKTVLCTIHQPSSAVFELFTHVILMREGSIVFQGTVQQALEAFSSCGRVCPRAYNPADFLLQTISDKSFVLSGLKDVIVEHRPPERWQLQPKSQSVCWFLQVYILLKRSAIESRRSMTEFLYKLTTFVLTAIFIGGLFMDVAASNQRSIQDVCGFIMNINCQIIFATAYNVVYYYPSKLPMLRRETGEQIYSLSAFYVANLLAAIPRSAIECFAFLAIIYPFVSFIHGLWQFVVIGLILTVVAIPSNAYGLMLSGLFESITVTTAMAPPFDVFLCVAAGIYIRLRGLWFLKYVSLFFYANESLMVIIWREIDQLDCSGAMDNGDYCLTNGDEVLRSMDYGTLYSTIWLDLAGLIGCACAMNAIGFIGVRRMVNRTGFY